MPASAKVRINTMLKISLFLLLKMCSANKVSFVYASNGAYLAAKAAFGAFFVINRGEVVFNGDSAAWAGLFALAARNASVFTVLTDCRTLVMIVTSNDYALCILNQVDYAVGAFLDAHTASDALFRINRGYAVFVYANSVTGADLNAIAVSEAGKVAELVSSVIHIGRLAGFGAVVIVFSVLRGAGAVAGNVCNLLDNVGCLNSEESRNFLCGAVTAGGAEVCFGSFTLGKGLCVSVASRKSARSAVCTWQAFADLNSALILFYTEERGRYGQKQGAENTCGKKNDNGN